MLRVVATPIGNPADLSERAIQAIRSCDYLICEEFKEGKRLLKRIGAEKECLALNEHNQGKVERDYIRLIQEGKTLVLVSDCGTPAYADPGRILLDLAHSAGIKVSCVPGPCSVTAALSLCGFDISSYHYGGFPPREKNRRLQTLKKWARLGIPVVILDTPYRLKALLEASLGAFGKNRQACLCLNLTAPDEKILRDGLAKLHKTVLAFERKSPFVLIIDRC